MKKSFSILLSAFVLVALSVACNKANPIDIDDQSPSSTDPATKMVTITATISDAGTRVSFDPAFDSNNKPTAMAHTWEAGDMLRVFDASNTSVYADFTLDPACVGSATGTFTGPGLTASSYNVQAIPAGGPFTSGGLQIQASDGDTDHLEFIAAATGVTDLTSITLTESSSILGIIAKLPQGAAAGIEELEIETSSDGFVNSSTLTVQITTAGDTDTDDILKIYANVPAGWSLPAGTEMFLRFKAPNTSHTVYTRYNEFPAAITSIPGKFNYIKMNCEHIDQYAGGSDAGTQAAPYLIADKYQMASINDLMVANDIRYFKLIDDITLGNNWTSLNPTPFTKKINLDGNGKTVSNLKASLFDDLNGTVANLTIDGADVNGGSAMTGILANTVKTAASSASQVIIANSKVEATAYTGGLIADIKVGKTTVSDVSIVNTNVKGTLAGGIIGFSEAELDLTRSSFNGNGTASTEPDKGIITATGPYAGGLVGATLNNVVTTIDDCHVLCAKLTSAYHRLAGAVGFLRAGSIIRNSSVGDSIVPVILTATGIDAQRTAGFVGEMGGGEVKDCTAYVTVTGVKSQIGGFIGQMTGGKVTGCKSYGTVNGPATIGGFFGEVLGATTITNNESNCEVTATSTYVGGFAGRLAGSVSCSNCYHKNGRVWSSIGGNAESFVGGFAGYIGNKTEAFTGTITGCYVNKAIVESVKYNEGSAQSSGTWVGGFAGGIGSSTYANNTGLVEKCGVYSADKAGGTYTGGFAGVSYAKIEKCRVNGRPTITGYGDSLGGFIGYQQGGHVKYCYSNAIPRHNNKRGVGGLIGTTKTTTVEECYASGNIVFSGSSQSNQGTSGGIIGRITGTPVTTLRLIRWNDSNFSNIVGGESSVPSGCYVKTSTDNDFQSVATGLGWSTDGTIWSYPADGSIPSLVGV